MCFNSTTSFVTFFISITFSTLLLSLGIIKNQKTKIFNSVISYLIGLMQLIEYFLWKNQKCYSLVNHYFTLSILFILFLQPVVTSLFYLFLFKPIINIYIVILFILIICYTIYEIYLLNYLNKNYILCSVPSKKNCRLMWDMDRIFIYTTLKNKLLGTLFYLFYYAIIFLLIFICIKKNNKNYGLIFLFITWIIAHFYNFITKGKSKSYVFGSVWCFLAVFFPAICLIFDN
jgi:hypothetical protein